MGAVLPASVHHGAADGLRWLLGRSFLRLAEPLPQGLDNQFIEYIKAMMGIHNIVIDGNCIDITYDLLQVTESQIEKNITDANIVLGDDVMEKIRRAFVHFTEEIEVESLEARPGKKCGHHH